MPVANRSKLKSGVYLITNTVNGKVYVGSAAKNIKCRWINHRKSLRGGRHSNAHLQSAWNKYEECKFEFTILINCVSDDCIRYEQFFINKYNAADPTFGYNISPTAGNCLGVVHTVETRKKMSDAHKGVKKTPEHTAKVAAANRGMKRSTESRAKMSAAKKGKKMPVGTLEKSVIANTGRPLSDKHKEKLSLAAKKRSANCYRIGWETRRINRLMGV